MSRRGRRTDIIVLGVMLGLAVMASLIAGAGDQSEARDPRRSTYSPSPDGLLAVYRLLDGFGVPIDRLAVPIGESALPERASLALIDPVLPVERDERAVLRGWVARGGTLITTTECLQGTGMSFLHEDRSTEELQVSGPLARDVRTVAISRFRYLPERFARPFESHWPELVDPVTLLTTDQDPLIREFPLAKGRVIVLVDGSLLTNALLDESDNAVLVANLVWRLGPAADRPLVFDEYHQGFGPRRSAWSVLKTALAGTSPGWGLLFLTLAFIAFLLLKGRRFGTRRDPAPSSRRRKLEYVEAVGETLRRRRARKLMVEILWRSTRRRCAERLGLPPTADSDTLADALARVGAGSAEAYLNELRRLDQSAHATRLTGAACHRALVGIGRIEREFLHANGRSTSTAVSSERPAQADHRRSG